MKSRWVEHKGKKIFISDYSNYGTNASALQSEADAVIKTLTQEPNYSVLSVTNVEGTKATTKNLQILRSVLPHTNNVVIKRAVIGATGLRWTFVDSINQFTGRAKIQSFNTLGDALDWIVQE